MLCFAPLVAAIAAGNAVVIKPSEIASSTASLIADLVPRYLDKRCFHVVNGAIPETTALLNCRFDHIFYTGNGSVGKIIMAAAAKNLTPVVLELGGKSPVYIDKTADAILAAKRIYWAKSTNAGQTCIAPDYILCHREKIDEFVKGFAKAQIEIHGEEIKSSQDYSRVVNANHYKRLVKVLNDQLAENPNSKAAIGGLSLCDEKDLFIPPTLVIGVEKDGKTNPIMRSEIFGPLLPVIAVQSEHEAIDYINQKYIFL